MGGRGPIGSTLRGGEHASRRYFRMLGQRPDVGSPHSLRLSPAGGDSTVRCLGRAVAPRAASAGFSGTRESLVLTVALVPWPARFHALDRTIWPALGSIYTPFTALPLPPPKGLTLTVAHTAFVLEPAVNPGLEVGRFRLAPWAEGPEVAVRYLSNETRLTAPLLPLSLAHW